MKTPCLKCGLIHDEPTAICDGYAGVEVPEGVVDSRRKAVERIRAVLAAVPIESRKPGRARAAAAGTSANAAQSSDTLRPVSGRAETPPAEVPEWRREVTERLESYRSRRERQRAANQSVLAFRVHSKTDTLEDAAESEVAPTATVDTIVDAPPETTAEASGGEREGNKQVPRPRGGLGMTDGGGEATCLRSSHIDRRDAKTAEDLSYSALESLAAASAVASENAAVTSATKMTKRVYAPVESSPAESLSEDTFAAAVALPAPDSAETSPIASAAPAALPIAAEPAVVLADSSILEVHADPAELAEVQSAALASGSVLMDSPPLATIPAIDTEYWRAQPAPMSSGPTPASPGSGPEAEETECGSLTSGFDIHATEIGEEALAEEVSEEELVDEDAALAAEQPVEEPGFAHACEAVLPSPTGEVPGLPPTEEAPAFAALAEDAASNEALHPDAHETTEEEELDSRRAALCTAARPPHGTAAERIEISVPQPVFDFSAASAENQQPRDQAPPVADLRERRCAAILDATILGFTIAGFFLAFRLAGGEFSFSRVGAAVSIAAAFLIYAQYILLFTMVGGSTPGMVLRGLGVVCFDGKRPEGVELAWRGFGYLLSAAAGMLGFLWSAWDEHGLTWHDRISQTYITYAEPEGVPAVLTLQ